MDTFVHSLKADCSGELNIGSGASISINQILQFIENIPGKPAEQKYLEGRKFDVPVNVLDFEKARTELEWEPATQLDKGIEKAIQWIQRVL